eukprot:gb/GEZN01012173.1/.p1 GENE.gb/GEZN01012173.1/~~gb/GEZN01012173.1/.p1  ORF type:complete len:353 (+),score=79.18 gb/GEZN01012173.1/:28-1086(+)
MSDNEGEDVEEESLEEVTLQNCQGKWLHSRGEYFTVKQNQVTFDSGDKYELTVAGNTLMLDGWKANPSKSSKSTITWEKEGEEPVSWQFEFELGEDGEVDHEEVDTANILPSRTRRRQVKPDYHALNRTIPKEDAFADDDDDDAKEEGEEDNVEDEAPPAKRQKQDAFSILQGRWQSSAGLMVVVDGSHARIGAADYIAEKTESGEISVDGWIYRPTKSTEEKLCFEKKGETDLYWKLLGDVDEGMDSRNIVSGKRGGGSTKKGAPVVILSRTNLFEYTKKLANNGQQHLDTKTATKILSSLESHKMTLDDLKLTKIGKEINRYRQHPDAGVALQAKNLLKKYKSLADAAKK